MVIFQAEREGLRAAMVQNYNDTKLKEHQKILQRHKIIEDRKEYIERLNTVREEEEQKRFVLITKKMELYYFITFLDWMHCNANKLWQNRNVWN